MFAVGIPSDVTVRLAVNTDTLTVPDSFLQTVTGTLFTFLGGSINKSAVTSKGKIHEVNESLLYGMVEKKNFKYLVKPPAGFHVMWRFKFKLGKEILDSDFLNRRSFFPFLIRFFKFFFWRMNRIRKILIIRELQPFLKVIKSAGARSVANSKAGKDGMKMVFPGVGSPFGIRSIMVSTAERSRFQNFSMISYVEEEKEEEAFG